MIARALGCVVLLVIPSWGFSEDPPNPYEDILGIWEETGHMYLKDKCSLHQDVITKVEKAFSLIEARDPFAPIILKEILDEGHFSRIPAQSRSKVAHHEFLKIGDNTIQNTVKDKYIIQGATGIRTPDQTHTMIITHNPDTQSWHTKSEYPSYTVEAELDRISKNNVRYVSTITISKPQQLQVKTIAVSWHITPHFRQTFARVENTSSSSVMYYISQNYRKLKHSVPDLHRTPLDDIHPVGTPVIITAFSLDQNAKAVHQEAVYVGLQRVYELLNAKQEFEKFEQSKTAPIGYIEWNPDTEPFPKKPVAIRGLTPVFLLPDDRTVTGLTCKWKYIGESDKQHDNPEQQEEMK